jgi:hypothetical protein
LDQCDFEEPADVVRAFRAGADAIERQRGASEQQEKSRSAFRDYVAGGFAETQSRSTIADMFRKFAV